jgi:hypothetical protein
MKKVYFILFIILLSVIHSIPIFLNSFCLGWDCGFYLYWLSPKANLSTLMSQLNIEPLFFYLLKPLVQISNPVIAIKIFAILSIPFFLFGCFILMRKMKFKWWVILICLVFFSLLPGISRLWFDTYRNFLAFSMFPYFIYFFFDERRYSTLAAIAVLALMAVSHRTFILPVGTLIVFSFFERKYLKKTFFTILPIVIGILLVSIFSSYGANLLNLVQSFFTQNFVFTNLTQMLVNINDFMFFNGIYLIVAIFSLLFLKIETWTKFWLIMFFGLFFFSIFYNNMVQGRAEIIATFPMIFIIGMFMNIYDKDNKTTAFVIMVFAIFSVAMTAIFGSVYLFGGKQNAYDLEVDLLKTLKPDDYIIVDSRLDYIAKYFSDMPASHVIVVDWYDFMNKTSTSSGKAIFYGTDDWKSNAANITKGGFYIMWSDLDLPVNNTIMQTRIERNEISIMIERNNVYFGELNVS